MSVAASLISRQLKLDDYLPYRLSMSANAVSQLVARAYAERFGLQPPQWRLLAALGEEGARTQQQLCGRTLMDKVTVMRAARALQARKLVRRSPNESDGRSHRLLLTPEGKRMYRQIVPLALEYEAVLLNGMTATEARQLDRWLRILQATATSLSRMTPSRITPP